MNKKTNFICLFLITVFSPLVVGNTELPDPTRPANYVVEDTDTVIFEEVDTKEKLSWNVSAIRISKNDKSAIVNGQLVRIGDEISSATVSEINPLSVVVNYEERKLIVRLFNNKIIKNYKSIK